MIEDAIYPGAFVDADGKPFDSGKKYVLRFDSTWNPPAVQPAKREFLAAQASLVMA